MPKQQAEMTPGSVIGRPKEISAECNTLHENIIDVENLVDNLEICLEPVLRPSEPTAPTTEKKELNTSMGRILNDDSAKLVGIANRIRYITSRLEI